MRTTLLMAGAGVVLALLDGARGAHLQSPLPQTSQTAQDTLVSVISFDPGPGRIGKNMFRLTVTNDRAAATPFLLSLRAESPSYALQKSHYRLLPPRETVSLEFEYELPNPGYRLLIAYHGMARSMPTDAEPYPAFVSRRIERFALHPEEQSAVSEPGPVSVESAHQAREAKRMVAETIGWDRPAAPAFGAQVREAEQLGDYRLQAVEIATEPDKTIGLLFIRRAAASGRLPTVLYLTGNPPGRKESGIPSGMILADLGFQVVAIDRRESARQTARGEFLTSRADPVFDARRAVDYLLTRADVDTARIGVLGFSKGAEEGMFLTALHPAVRIAALASRLLVQDSLFKSDAWLPTVYSEDVLHDLGLDALTDDWSKLRAAITPEVAARALIAYRARYPYFDSLDPAVVLPLAAPKPVLLVSGARDRQIVLPGVLALDSRVRTVYREMGVAERAELIIMPRSDHGMPGDFLEQVGRWMNQWFHALPTQQ